MDGPFRILMVCTANQCRSPMAELMLRRRMYDAPAPGSIEISGVGTRTVDGRPITELTAAQLIRRGIDPSGFLSTAMTPRAIERSDLILTATKDHRSRIVEEVPLALRRTFTMLEFAAIAPTIVEATDLKDLVGRSAAARGTADVAEYDIVDPVGGPDEGYSIAAALIDSAMATIAPTLVSLL